MQSIPSRCPFCKSELEAVRLHCPSCDTSIEGRFSTSRLTALSDQQLEFVITFVRCEGKINRVEQELGLSYPTIRNRLQDVILAMGYEPKQEEEAERTADKRLAVLDELDSGRITADEAMRALREA